jgi:2-polyprenyl-6-methoxyphenol hydroxylase-like FAD-dependent oxidoreductase
LNILIAGAGIGGLAAAVGLRQQGHHVTLFEKSRLNKEIGAAMFIAPNCCGILHHWGIDPVENGSVELHGMNMHDAAGNLRNSLDTREAYKHVPHTWEMMHRAHVHNALKQKALSPEGPGAPATLHVHSEILSADPTNATITTADGRVHQGDLIIGADGVHSKIRNSIPGCTQQPFDSGKNAFRSLIPMSKIAADPVASSILKDADHYFQLWAGPDRSVIMYPCASNTQMNVALVHPSPRTDRPHDAADHWQRPASKAEMLEVARDFDPRVLAVLELADEAELKRWTLLDLEKVPRFTHERLVLVGDAAHPFLPCKSCRLLPSLPPLLPIETPTDQCISSLQTKAKAAPKPSKTAPPSPPCCPRAPDPAISPHAWRSTRPSATTAPTASRT